MRFLRQSATIIGVCAGLAYAPDVVRSEQSQTAEQSWLSWLVRTPSDRRDRSIHGPFVQKELVLKPGRVVVWGGVFGRSPRPIQGIGDNIVKVAAGDGLGAALDCDGKVHGFVVRSESDVVETIQVQGRVRDVVLREGAREVIILDASGRVTASKCTKEGSFEPAKSLEGAINGARIDKVRCGREHCVAVTKQGGAFSWGSTNSHGQLGSRDSAMSSPHIPNNVKLPDGVTVGDAACGNRHTIFLDRDGALFGMGDDHWAQLGISAEPWLNSHEEASGIVRKSELVAGLAGRAIAGGGQHSVMLVRDGTVFSFGFNQWGQLGHHNYSSLAPPSPIADYTIRAAAISAGENHTCIVKENGEMWCIGGNDQGQLGTGNLQPSMVWKKVRLGRKVLKPSYIYVTGNTSAAVLPVDKDRDSSVL